MPLTKVQSQLLGTGTVLQVVQGTPMTTVFSTTSTSYVDITGLSATITPTSATSKIVVFVFLSDIAKDTTNYDAALRLQLVRGATTLVEQTNQMFGFSAAAGTVSNDTIIYMDSPNSTSATTYKMQLHSRTGSSVSVNSYYTTAKSNVFLMEIAG